jgi:hypothetical protein
VNTLIYCTKDESLLLALMFEAPVLATTADIPRATAYLARNPSGTLLCVGKAQTYGWRTPGPAHVVFTSGYPQDPALRAQALARARQLP